MFVCLEDNEFHWMIIILKAVYVVTNGQAKGSDIILNIAVFRIF